MNSYSKGPSRGNGNSDRGFRGGRGGRGRGQGRRSRGGFSGRGGSPDRRSAHSEDGNHGRRMFDNYRQQERPMSRSPSPVDNRVSYETRQQSSRRERRELSPSDLFGRERRTSSPTPSSTTVQVQPSMTKNEIARMWKLKLEDAEEAVRRAEYNLRRARIEKENTLQEYNEYRRTL